MADTSRFPSGVLISQSPATARPVGTIIYDTSTSQLAISTNASVATYSQLSGAGLATIADPGTGAAIPVTASGAIALTIGAGAETNTLAIPTFLGQTLTIVSSVQGAGTRAITSAQAINQAGNTIMTFAALADFIMLRAVSIAGALRWRVVANDGVALS